MKIMPLQYGESVLPEELIFINGEKNKDRDIVFKVFLIKCCDKLILVDAGCETMPGFVMRNFIGPVKALEDVNVSPEEITDVILTHSHHDHIECVKYYKNAVIHVEAGEYDKGKVYIPDGFNVNVFSDEYVVANGVKALKIGGHSNGSCVVEISDGDKTYVITGDECYLRECITYKIPTGSSVNPDASKKFIDKYSDSKYEVLFCHDI